MSRPPFGLNTRAPGVSPAVIANVIEVAAGILQSDGSVLISERKGDAAFAGLWEFPGGKRESGEAFEDALARELDEELGVQVTLYRRLITLEHEYPDRHVRIDFFLVTEWQGTPEGRQGQAVRWVPIEALSADELLPADAPVVAALMELRTSSA